MPPSFILAKLDEPTGRFARRSLSPFFLSNSMTKLYVGNLPFNANEDAVRALFAKHGTVEKVSLITDRETGRPRGFGFVEMSNADASRAMQALNGADMDGRALKVNEAQDRERSGGGNRGPRRY
jgi:RNA recognition motif-containing protein